MSAERKLTSLQKKRKLFEERATLKRVLGDRGAPMVASEGGGASSCTLCDAPKRKNAMTCETHWRLSAIRAQLGVLTQDALEKRISSCMRKLETMQQAMRGIRKIRHVTRLQQYRQQYRQQYQNEERQESSRQCAACGHRKTYSNNEECSQCGEFTNRASLFSFVRSAN